MTEAQAGLLDRFGTLVAGHQLVREPGASQRGRVHVQLLEPVSIGRLEREPEELLCRRYRHAGDVIVPHATDVLCSQCEECARGLVIHVRTGYTRRPGSISTARGRLGREESS